MSKRGFVKTTNYIKMHELLSTLVDMEDSKERIGLGYGAPGLGKTTALERLAKEFDAIFVRVLESWTPATAILAIADAVGVEKKGKSSEVVERVIEALLIEPRAIIVDEIDRALYSTKIGILENIRDLHDQARVPILLVGMAQCDARLQRYKHFYDRIVKKVQFVDTPKRDIELFINRCGIEEKSGFRAIKIEDDLKKYLTNKYKSIRAIKVVLKMIEMYCELNSWDSMDLKAFREAKIESKAHERA